MTGTKTYYPAAGAMRIGSTLYFVLKDHLGSASVVTGSTGTIVGEDRFNLSPWRHLRYASTFGETRFTTGTMFTDKLFTGQREMAGLGIYHYGARFYSPQVRRSDMGAGNWAIETHLALDDTNVGDHWQINLVAGFDRYDQQLLSVDHDGYLTVRRVSEEEDSYFEEGISLPLYLRIEKSGTQFTFRYKKNTQDPWTTVDTQNIPTEVSYVGLQTRTFYTSAGDLVLNMDYFRLERYGTYNPDPGPTKEIELDDFDNPSLDSDWTWYVPKEGPSYSLSAVNGAFRMILPELNWFNQTPEWGDEAPQLRRTDMGTGDWAIEARLENTSAAADAGFWPALEAVFDPLDQARLGITTDVGGQPYVRAFMQGLNEGSWSAGNAPIILRMEKHGEEYTFKFRHNPNEAWTVMAPMSYGATPQYVGLITHAWETGSQEMHVDWSYFRLERWAAEQGLMAAPDTEVERPEVEQEQATPSVETTRTPTPTPMRTMTPTRTGTPTFTATPTPPAQSMSPALPPRAVAPGLTAKFVPVSFNMPIPNRISAPYQQSGPITITYDYDPLYRLTEANYSNGDYYHYSYDPVGNRLSQDTQLGGLPTTTTYFYDDANRLTDVNGVTYTWDNNGNLLDDGVNTYTYDSANRLKTLTGPSLNAGYSYNGLGDRLQETMNGNTTTFTMDLNAGLTQALSDGTNNYIYGLDRIAQMQGETTEYFLGDALGSVRQMVDTNAEITYARAYNPYGVVSSTFGSSQSAYGFGGEYSDSYIKLIYLRSRWYDPASGRFPTKDSWQGDYNRPLSLNRWAYVEENPINRTDPSGQCYIDGGNMRRWKVWEYPIVGPCRDNSGPISPDEPHWHEYWSANLVCSEWLNCSREEVVDALARFTFPGQNPLKPVQPDQQSFVAPFSWFPGIELNGMPVEYLGAIHSIIFEGGLHVRNVSEPTHIFHKGQVDRQAKQIGKAWYVVTHGTGNNIYFAMDVVNQVTGSGIFTDVDRLMRQYLETIHILKWIKGLDC